MFQAEFQIGHGHTCLHQDFQSFVFPAKNEQPTKEQDEVFQAPTVYPVKNIVRFHVGCISQRVGHPCHCGYHCHLSVITVINSEDHRFTGGCYQLPRKSGDIQQAWECLLFSWLTLAGLGRNKIAELSTDQRQPSSSPSPTASYWGL